MEGDGLDDGKKYRLGIYMAFVKVIDNDQNDEAKYLLLKLRF